MNFILKGIVHAGLLALVVALSPSNYSLAQQIGQGEINCQTTGTSTTSVKKIGGPFTNTYETTETIECVIGPPIQKVFTTVETLQKYRVTIKYDRFDPELGITCPPDVVTKTKDVLLSSVTTENDSGVTCPEPGCDKNGSYVVLGPFIMVTQPVGTFTKTILCPFGATTQATCTKLNVGFSQTKTTWDTFTQSGATPCPDVMTSSETDITYVGTVNVCTWECD